MSSEAITFDGLPLGGHTLTVDPAELPPGPGAESGLRPAPTPLGRRAGARSEAPSFERVYEEGFPFVFRVLRSLGVHPDRLEDAAQDVFTVVHRKLSDFEGRSSIRTWLFAIAHRVASDHRRREKRKSSLLAPLSAELTDEGVSPQAHVEGQQAADFVDEFVKSLSAEKRTVFALAFMEEMPAPEVAEALGIPLNTAYSRIRNVRADLRKALERRKLR
jgi:RNA polymerase sigma-70 factor, ECF subfamily